MAYDPVNNPPVLTSTAPLGQEGGRTWSYRSSDSSSLVDTDGYFSNGKALGMRVGDYIRVGQRGTPNAVSEHVVNVVNSNGSVDISNNLYFSGSQDLD